MTSVKSLGQMAFEWCHRLVAHTATKENRRWKVNAPLGPSFENRWTRAESRQRFVRCFKLDLKATWGIRNKLKTSKSPENRLSQSPAIWTLCSMWKSTFRFDLLVLRHMFLWVRSTSAGRQRRRYLDASGTSLLNQRLTATSTRSTSRTPSSSDALLTRKLDASNISLRQTDESQSSWQRGFTWTEVSHHSTAVLFVHFT